MTIKHKLLLAAGAVALAAVGITGVMAAGRVMDCGTACPKSDCGTECPKKAPCPHCPICSGA